MEYEKCYVFQPEEDTRPLKRRKVEIQGLQTSWHSRRAAYEQAWGPQRDRIDSKLNTINAATVSEIRSFLDDVSRTLQPGQIPTGLVLAGPNSALRKSISSQISAGNSEGIKRLFVSISSGSGSSVKAVLKSIIQQATLRASGEDDDELEETATSKKGPKLLNYDLQILYDYIKERKIEQVILAFEDTEAFDSDLLSELIELVACWQDRIPFACLLNVATSVEFLQQRLTKDAVKCLDGRLFDAAVSTDEVEQVFETITDPALPLFMGPNLMSMILERHSDYVQGIDSLRDATQYAYMSHYYANALSIFLDPAVSAKSVQANHVEALRNLPSFRALARQLLDNAQTMQLRNLLDSDKAMFEYAVRAVAEGRVAITNALKGTEVIRALQECLPNTTVSSKSNLYIQAMSGKLQGSLLIRSLLLIIKKSPSDVAMNLIKMLQRAALPTEVGNALTHIEDKLATLITNQNSADKPLRSEEDMRNSTLRTTVVAQKVELSKQKSALSEQDATYTQILRSLAETIDSYLKKAFIDPKELVMNEIFIYDLRSPYREVFTPRPRQAIERALAAPHDYLDCECCAPSDDSEEATLTASQPATAMLYQLYLESGSLINASDLWMAFQAVNSDAEEDDQGQMALFQRALAELRYMGFVKSTRKRVDHIAKVAWRGL